MTLTPEAFGERLESVREDIAARGRDATIVAVTKGFGPAEILVAHAAGVRDIGESYAQELLTKIDSIPADVDVHFIGRIQRNKVRRIVDRVSLWHSVARPEVIDEIGRRAEDVNVLIQIRPEGDPSKEGIAAEDLESTLARAHDAGVIVRGLMTMGVFGDDSATRTAFARTRRLAERFDLAEISMGMSDDYRLALDEGATILRLGTILFGPRPPR